MPGAPLTPAAPESTLLADVGLADLDLDALIRSSSYCAMVHASHQLGREIAPALAEAGLTPTLYLVLGQVLAAGGASQAELARRCGLLPQTLAAVVAAAEARNLVEHEGPRGRGHRSRVRITGDGIALLVSGWPVVHRAGGDRLSPTQHLLVQSLLDQLRGRGSAEDDLVVLVDETGREVGTRPRATVHTTDTPLHLAFSTYLRRDDGHLLLTRRSVVKRTWPGVWTNSACGHVRPGEHVLDAALRRVPAELGVRPDHLQVVLPDFRYRAVDTSGIVEHEHCPVLVGVIDPARLEPDPAEVADHQWVTWEQLRRLVDHTPFLLSPWCVEQVIAMGDRPW